MNNGELNESYDSQGLVDDDLSANTDQNGPDSLYRPEIAYYNFPF